MYCVSTDSNFLQEVEELQKQGDAKYDEDVEQKLSQKMLERDLAEAKYVREISGY